MFNKRDKAYNNKKKRNVCSEGDMRKKNAKRERDVYLRPEQGLGKQGGGMFSFIFSTQLVERHRRERERETVRGARH